MTYLEINWHDIRKKVIIPLWNRKFKNMYENAKMDFDDFESLSAIELTKAMKSFNPEMSNLFTYATNVINKKATTELRNCTRRDVRKASHIAQSVNAIDSSIIENIPSPVAEERSELSSLRVGNFVNSLNNNQLRVLILNLLEFDITDMPDMLNISKRTVSQIFSSLKDSDITRVLYRRNF